jgi:hypothetical protein
MVLIILLGLAQSQSASTDSGAPPEDETTEQVAVINGDFVSRVSTLPLVTSMLTAYSQGKASSRMVKVSILVVVSNSRINRLLRSKVRCADG